MNHTPSGKRKFDTLRLLDGVPNTGEYQAEDILKEFSAAPASQPQAAPHLAAVPLNPPPRPKQAAPSTDSFFTAPPEIDTLGDDFWSGSEGESSEDEALWDEIESMGRHKKPRRGKQADAADIEARPAAPSEPNAQPYQPQPAFADDEPETKPARPERKPERDSARQRRRRLQEAEARTPKPDIPPDRAVRHFKQRADSARRRLPPLVLVNLLALYFTLAGSFGWLAPAMPALCRLAAVLSLLSPALCYDLVIATVYDLFRLRFRAETLVLASTVCCAVDAFLAAGAEAPHVPYCLLPSLAWLCCLWGAYYRHQAMRRTAKTLERSSGTVAVRSVPSFWNGTDCIVKTSGEPAAFLREMEERDYADQLMQYYVPIAAAGALILSLVVLFVRGSSLPQTLAMMLSAATPLAGALCFARPFALLARRLYRSHAALCGWMGAELLGGYQAVVLRDSDLFPVGAVSMNGAKFYGRFDKEYVISCTATIFRETGGDLAPVFEGMAQDFHTGFGVMTSYRAYEGGGYGANIGQDIVLVGSVSFMRLMGIAIPDNTDIRQAVYVAINNELAGLFSINYAPSRQVRMGLDALCAQRRLLCLCATRDFILNPALLRQRFRLSGGRLEFPPVDERLRLSAEDAGSPGRRAALLDRDRSADYLELVAGSRLLYNLTRGSSLLCLLSGIIGLALMFVLCYLGETISATAANLLLYSVLWALPPLLIGSWVDKY